MQKKTRLRLLDLFIVIICSSLCAFSLYCFWKDLNASSSRKDKEQIASIEFKHRVAQRKYSDRLVWERLQQNSPLYDADTIRTAQGSSATVTFTDGTVLQLHENTMLQVSYDKDGELKLSVNDGNIEVDTSKSDKNKKVSLSMNNDSVFELETGSKLSASSNTLNGDSSFSLKSGSASLTSKDSSGASSVQALSSGESLRVDSSGGVKKAALTVISNSLDEKVLAFNDEKTLPFVLKWKVSEPYKNSVIIAETSKDKNFDKIQDSYSIKNSDSVKFTLQEGKLYWRLYPQGKIEEAESGRITMEKVPPVVLTSPQHSSVFTYRKDDLLPSVQLTWKGNDYSSYYKIEISASKDFADTVISQNVEQESFTVNTLKEGSYWWKVTPYYMVNSQWYSKPSKPQSFSLLKNDELKPPKLSFPADGGILSFNVNSENSLTFQWKSDVKKADYKVIVASDSDFKNHLYEKTTKENRITENFTLSKMPQGKYYWKVVRTSLEDLFPCESEIRSFEILRNIPGQNKLIYPPDNFSVESKKLETVSFIWKLAPENQKEKKETVFEISDNPDFKDTKQKVQTKNQSVKNIKLSEGTYWWRIGLKNSDNSLEYTSSRTFTVVSPMEIPVFTEPKENSILTFYDKNDTKSLLVKWTEIPQADFYRLRVYDQNEKLVSEKSSLKENSFELNLSAGTYFCSVEAFSKESSLEPLRTSTSAPLNFTVRQAKMVQLLSPKDKSQIKGLTAIRQPLTFTWQTGDKIANCEFVLQMAGSDGNFKTVKKISNPKNKVSLEKMQAGTYRWTVNATSGDGHTLSAPDFYDFVITQIPLLESPILVFPKNAQTIGSQYLKANRTVVFSWNKVEGAGDYDFVLYQKKPDGSLKKIHEEKNIRQNQVKIADLSLFDIGDFEWTVTAFLHSKDGYEEQKSKTSRATFKINFDLPKKVETLDPGILYAE